jgi:hypothetical protein
MDSENSKSDSESTDTAGTGGIADTAGKIIDSVGDKILSHNPVEAVIGSSLLPAAVPVATMNESLLTDSRLSPFGSGNLEDKPICTAPTSGQKWWAAIVLGLVFAIVSSPPAYAVTSAITTAVGAMPLYTFTDTYPGQTILALIIHTIIFIIIVRLLLW